MPAQVKKLIAELKRQYPELQDESILDDILDASYNEGETAGAAESMDQADMGDTGDTHDMGTEGDDTETNPDDMPPPPKRKGGPRM